jgi:O-antigen/teichoic acid export membrane protein
LNRKFLLNIIFLIILNLLIKPFWFFGIEVAVQNRLGNEAYGLYLSLLNFAIIFNFLLDLGITNFNNRELARHNNLISKYFSNIIILKLLFAFVYFVSCLVCGAIVGYSSLQFKLLLLLLVNQIFSSFILYLRSNINALLMFVTDSILSVLDKALMILFLSVLLWSNLFDGVFKVEWFIYCQTIAFVITAIVAGTIVLKQADYFTPRFDRRYLIIILKKSAPFTLLVFLMAIYNRIEPVLLERLLPDGKTQAGIYAQGFRILEVMSNFSLLFPVLLLPIFSKMLKQKEDVSSLVSLSSNLLLVPAIIVALSCFVYSNEIMNMLYHLPESGIVFRMLILGYIGMSLTYIYGTLLTANGSFKQLNIMASLAVVLNIGLNLILIPHFKSIGASWSSFLTQTITGLAQTILAFYILGLKIEKTRFVSLISWVISLLLVLWVVKWYFANWYSGFIIILGFGLISSFIFKVLNLKEISGLLFTLKGNEPKPIE